MIGKKPRLLMGVYNPIDYDGRVQRSAVSLAADYDVTVLSVHSDGRYRHEAFRSESVRLPAGGSKYVAHLRFARGLLAAARRLRPAVVYGHDYFMAMPAWLAARRVGARFVYDAHELVIPGPGERLPPRERVWYWMERAVVRRAELVVAANEERAELMRAHYGLGTAPLVVRNITAPSPGVLDDAEVEARYPGLRRLRADERLVVYQGDMSFSRGIGVFLDAARQLPANTRLVLVGSGPDFAALTERVASPELSGRVTQLGRVPRDHLHDIMRRCDVGLITYDSRGLNNIYCAPNKLYEYAQAGLPVVTSDQPPLRAAVERYGVGEVVGGGEGRPADGAAWAHAIARVCAGMAAYRARLGRFLDAHRWSDDQDRLRRALAGRPVDPTDAEPPGEEAASAGAHRTVPRRAGAGGR